MRVLPSGPGVANHRLSGLPGARSAKAPKTEATELESELPLSADSGHSQSRTPTADIDPKPTLTRTPGELGGLQTWPHMVRLWLQSVRMGDPCRS